jgi:hypothetical protein
MLGSSNLRVDAIHKPSTRDCNRGRGPTEDLSSNPTQQGVPVLPKSLGSVQSHSKLVGIKAERRSAISLRGVKQERNNAQIAKENLACLAFF